MNSGIDANLPARRSGRRKSHIHTGEASLQLHLTRQKGDDNNFADLPIRFKIPMLLHFPVLRDPRVKSSMGAQWRRVVPPRRGAVAHRRAGDIRD
jgi:hypothetical protein